VEYASDIAEMIIKYRGSSPEVKVLSLRELYEVTKVQTFLDEANAYWSKMDMCPKCFKNLLISENKEYRGEYLGFPSYEYTKVRYCPNCGWREE